MAVRKHDFSSALADVHAADLNLRLLSLRQLNRRRERLASLLRSADGDDRAELRVLLEATDDERRTR